ncbi:hypothetical protein BSKO_03508 [Bryopsis sp. KO-2023]|nr:hypothetical protein BSKO_03508 [Bryopsis sp. KO-2023]
MSSQLDSPRLPEDLDVDAEVQKVMNAWIEQGDFDLQERIQTIWYGETPPRLQHTHSKTVRGGSEQEEVLAKQSLAARAESSPSIIYKAPRGMEGKSSEETPQEPSVPTTSSMGATSIEHHQPRRKNSIPPISFEGSPRHWTESSAMATEKDGNQEEEYKGSIGTEKSDEEQDEESGQGAESLHASFLASTTGVHLRETDSEILLMPGVSSGSSGLSGVTIDQIMSANSSGSIEGDVPVSQLGMEDAEERAMEEVEKTLELDEETLQDSPIDVGNSTDPSSAFWEAPSKDKSSVTIARATSSVKQAAASSPEYMEAKSWHQIAKATSTPAVVIDKALATIPTAAQDDSSVSDAMWKLALDTSITAKDIPRALPRTVSNESQTMEIAEVGKVESFGLHDRMRSKSRIVVKQPSGNEEEAPEPYEEAVLVPGMSASDIPTLEALESTLEEFRRISDSSGTFELSRGEGSALSQADNSNNSDAELEGEDVALLLEPEETEDKPNSVPQDMIQKPSSWGEFTSSTGRSTIGGDSDEVCEDFTTRWFSLLLDDESGEKKGGKKVKRRRPKSSPSHSNKAISRDTAFESLHRGGTVMASGDWWKESAPSWEDYVDKVAAFQPQINKRSARLAEKIYQKTAGQGPNPGKGRLEFLYKLGTLRPQEREIAMVAHRQRLEDSELKEECTFCPRTNTFRHDRSKSVCLHEMLPLQIRADKWMHRRDAKLDMYRKMKTQKEEDECTFWPDTADSKRTLRAVSPKRRTSVTVSRQRNANPSQPKSEVERARLERPPIDEAAIEALGLKKKKKKKKRRDQQHQLPYKLQTSEKLYIPSTVVKPSQRDKWTAAAGSSNCDVALDRGNGDFRIMSVGVDRKEARNAQQFEE